jgi:hypothetical protein
MERSGSRIVSRGFLVAILLIALFTLAIPILFPTSRIDTKARNLVTLHQERVMLALLEQKATWAGGLTNISDAWILDAFSLRNQDQFILNASNTNASGAVIDIWKTPYHIELTGPTNFTIRSAGRNRRFGDKDDIVFGSASNSAVKP